MRLGLAKLGYTTDSSKLTAEKADAFCMISRYIDQLQAEEMRAHKAKNSRGK